jgi:hypothetical protein
VAAALTVSSPLVAIWIITTILQSAGVPLSDLSSPQATNLALFAWIILGTIIWRGLGSSYDVYKIEESPYFDENRWGSSADILVRQVENALKNSTYQGEQWKLETPSTDAAGITTVVARLSIVDRDFVFVKLRSEISCTVKVQELGSDKHCQIAFWFDVKAPVWKVKTAHALKLADSQLREWIG